MSLQTPCQLARHMHLISYEFRSELVKNKIPVETGSACAEGGI